MDRERERDGHGPNVTPNPAREPRDSVLVRPDRLPLGRDTAGLERPAVLTFIAQTGVVSPVGGKQSLRYHPMGLL